jgi:YD repeat-containing protein
VALLYGASGNATGAGPHQARIVGGQSYSYDPNGNLTSGGGRTLEWWSDNQPLSVTSGGVSESYTYDADGQRVTKVRAGVTTVYLEGGLWEETAGGTAKLTYLVGGQAVAVRSTAGFNLVTYLHTDHLGSVSVATDTSGALVSRAYYDPWGKIRRGSVPQSARSFTGQYLDDTGLLFYNARYGTPRIRSTRVVS